MDNRSDNMNNKSGTTNNVNIALVGYGFSASVFHAPIIDAIDDLTLTTVVSSNAGKVTRDYPDVAVVSDIDEVLKDETIDAVVITTPNDTHYKFAKRALTAGKHVVVEKPFVLHAEEADELVQIAEESGLILSVYQNRRWDSDFLTLKANIADGTLGNIHTYEAHFDRFRPHVRDRWRERDVPGAGLLYDLGSHLIDQAIHLFGPPKTVSADLMLQRPAAQTVDYFHLVLGYDDPLRVILHGGCLVLQTGPRFAVHGDRGSFFSYGLDPQEAALKQGHKPGSAAWATAADAARAIDVAVTTLPTSGGEQATSGGEQTTSGANLPTTTTKVTPIPGSYASYYRVFAAAILHGEAPPVASVDGRETIRVIEAAMRSHAEGRVVSLKA